MKKLWAGIVILAALLAMGAGSAAVMQHLHQDLASRLEQAAAQCRSDWPAAASLSADVQKSWEQHRYWVAALSDHEPLEEIAALFSQLDLCRSNGDRAEFAVVCLRIASLCDALGESQTPYWWNLL